jgi:hypothetical protein
MPQLYKDAALSRRLGIVLWCRIAFACPVCGGVRRVVNRAGKRRLFRGLRGLHGCNAGSFARYRVQSSPSRRQRECLRLSSWKRLCDVGHGRKGRIRRGSNRVLHPSCGGLSSRAGQRWRGCRQIGWTSRRSCRCAGRSERREDARERLARRKRAG